MSDGCVTVLKQLLYFLYLRPPSIMPLPALTVISKFPCQAPHSCENYRSKIDSVRFQM